ncbi:hypothetical protein K1719_029275 [Acacia pycnantha]|nr:hypothetical protein K1719_029275 [Acacia pycnantha]
MANYRTRIFCAILIAVILMLQSRVVHVDGRHIRSGLRRGFHKHHGQHTVNNKAHFAGRVHRKKRATRRGRVEYEVDDFRPTSPGHSPGVGHSINN